MRYQRLHLHFSADHDLKGVQKFHIRVVPRIGGLGIFCGLLLGLLPRWFVSQPVAIFSSTLIFCAFFSFVVGFLEDITKKIGAKERLIATMFSALMAGFLFGAWITNVQIIGVDYLLTIPIVSFVFS